MDREYTGRREDPRLVTGRGAYTSDHNLPGQVHAVFVRSDRPHAKILSIDTSAAEAAAGVVGVFTARAVDEVGFNRAPPQLPLKGIGDTPLFDPERPALARERVRFIGEAVVLVAAETREQAADAAEMVAIDYEDLPVLASTEQATAAGAFQMHEGAYGNFAFHGEYGDPAATEAAFAEAPLTARVVLNSQRLSGVPMEPRSCLVAHEPATDSFDLWVSNQGIVPLRANFAQVTGIPTDRLRFHPQDVGGAFGVRSHPYPEYFAAMAASRRLGRPVKWTGTRAESLMTDHHGRGVLLTGELALDREGRFLAVRLEWLADVGAYLSTSIALVRAVSPQGMAVGAYAIPVVHGVNKLCFTNASPTAAYRGLHGRTRPISSSGWWITPPGYGFDPAELRRKNFIPATAFPYKTPIGQTYDSGDFDALLDAVLKESDWAGYDARRAGSEAGGKLRGRGLAVFISPSGSPGVEQGTISFEADGKVTLRTVSGASGQGHETAFPEIAAEQLGLEPEEITLRWSEADTTLKGGLSGGSRSGFSVGGATLSAGAEVISKGKALAAEALDAPLDEIDFSEGLFRRRGANTSISLRELAKRHTGDGPNPLDSLGEFQTATAWPSGAHVAEVEIDPETGELEIVNYVAVDDLGAVINHTLVVGQMQGGVMQGAGQILGEHMIYDERGQLLTGTFMDYFMPHARNVFPLDLHMRNVPAPGNPLGAKGAAEAGTTGAVPTLCNAVIDALAPLGVTHLDTPFTPNRLWGVINAARADRPTA